MTDFAPGDLVECVHIGSCRCGCSDAPHTPPPLVKGAIYTVFTVTGDGGIELYEVSPFPHDSFSASLFRPILRLPDAASPKAEPVHIPAEGVEA